jgi:hypothetical protein
VKSNNIKNIISGRYLIIHILHAGSKIINMIYMLKEGLRLCYFLIKIRISNMNNSFKFLKLIENTSFVNSIHLVFLIINKVDQFKIY